MCDLSKCKSQYYWINSKWRHIWSSPLIQSDTFSLQLCMFSSPRDIYILSVYHPSTHVRCLVISWVWSLSVYSANVITWITLYQFLSSFTRDSLICLSHNALINALHSNVQHFLMPVNILLYHQKDSINTRTLAKSACRHCQSSHTNALLQTCLKSLVTWLFPLPRIHRQKYRLVERYQTYLITIVIIVTFNWRIKWFQKFSLPVILPHT